ncbi:MAG: hypothetical protein ACLQE9_09870 [Roseiarcus sp.]
MPPAAKLRSVGEGALVAVGPRALDLLMSGQSVDNIADARNHTRARVERILRAELKAISIRPARDYAKLQIRRLESMLVRLIEKANDGDLAAVDRILKILDRLDRYHGFVKLPATSPQADDQAYEQLLKKLADMAARREKAKEEA